MIRDHVIISFRRYSKDSKLEVVIDNYDNVDNYKDYYDLTLWDIEDIKCYFPHKNIKNYSYMSNLVTLIEGLENKKCQ